MLRTVGFIARSTDEIIDGMVAKPPFSPTLAIIFSSARLGLPGLVQALADKGVPVFGSSSGGEILASPTDAPVHEQTAVCCLLDLPQMYFVVQVFDRKNEPATEFGRRIGTWGAAHFSRPAFIISIANLDNNGEAMIRGIEEVCPGNTPVFGGFAGDTAVPKNPAVFTEAGIVYDGAVAIVFDLEKVAVQGVTTSGWTGIGIDLAITAAEDRIVYTINDRPAIDIVEDYLDVSDAELLQIAINYPLLVKRPDGTEVLRTIFSADFAGRSLRFAGSVPQGSKVMFSSSFGKNTIMTAIRDIASYHPGHPKADLLLLFSCLARLRSAGPRVNDEIMAAYNLWKCPLVGLFCCGEIGPAGTGTCELLNDSISLVQIHVKEPE